MCCGTRSLSGPLAPVLLVLFTAFGIGAVGGPIRAQGGPAGLDPDVGSPDGTRASALLLTAATAKGDKKFEALTRLQDVPVEERVVAYRRGLRSGVGSVRALSAFQLGVVSDTAAAPLLARRTLVDREAEVRSNALRAYERLALHTPDDEAIRPFVQALSIDHHPVLRMRAAEALGSLGRAAAVPALLGAFQTAGTGSYRAPSNHIFVGREQALVTDFDVEVAQAAVIADPIITHVREGAQLEVRVIAVEADLVIKQRVFIGRALDRLTGQAFGPDEKMWQLWWDTLGSKD